MGSASLECKFHDGRDSILFTAVICSIQNIGNNFERKRKVNI